MKFESIARSKTNNSVEEIINPNEELANKTFTDVENFTKTRDGKKALDNVWDAQNHNPDYPESNSKRVNQAKENYESSVEKKGGISESLQEKIGADQERVKSIISRMRQLKEKKKEIFKRKVHAKISKTLFAFGAGGSLAGVSALVASTIDQVALNQLLDTPGGKIAAVTSIAAMCCTLVAPIFASSKAHIEESITQAKDVEESIKTEISDSIESSNLDNAPEALI